jgi:hypothetical protein
MNTIYHSSLLGILTFVLSSLGAAQVTVAPNNQNQLTVFNGTTKNLVAVYFEIRAKGDQVVYYDGQTGMRKKDGEVINQVLRYTGQILPPKQTGRIQENTWGRVSGVIANQVSLFSDHSTEGQSTWDIKLFDANITASKLHRQATVRASNSGSPQDPAIMDAIDFDNHNIQLTGIRKWKGTTARNVIPNSYQPPSALIVYQPPTTCETWGQYAGDPVVNFTCDTGFKMSYPGVGPEVWFYYGSAIAYLIYEENLQATAGATSGKTAGIYPQCFGPADLTQYVYSISQMSANCITGGDVNSDQTTLFEATNNDVTYGTGVLSEATLETADLSVDVSQYWTCVMANPFTITGDGPCPNEYEDKWIGGSPNQPL